MSLRKPILKVTKECPNCKGDGSVMMVTTYSNDPIGRKICSKCEGIGKVDVRHNNKDFKKYYIKNLEEIIEYWTTKYRNAKAEVFDIGEELRKYCKELDKVVNK